LLINPEPARIKARIKAFHSK